MVEPSHLMLARVLEAMPARPLLVVVARVTVLRGSWGLRRTVLVCRIGIGSG